MYKTYPLVIKNPIMVARLWNFHQLLTKGKLLRPSAVL